MLKWNERNWTTLCSMDTICFWWWVSKPGTPWLLIKWKVLWLLQIFNQNHYFKYFVRYYKNLKTALLLSPEYSGKVKETNRILNLISEKFSNILITLWFPYPKEFFVRLCGQMLYYLDKKHLSLLNWELENT